MLSSDLLSLAYVPEAVKPDLAELYQSKADCVALFAADWAEAYFRGAIRMFSESKVSFATHFTLPNGRPVEASISVNSNDGGLPWYVSYVPRANILKYNQDEGHYYGARTRVEAREVPTLLEQDFASMKASDDYRENQVPAELLDEIVSLQLPFDRFVWISRKFEEQILELSQEGPIDVKALLARDWNYALKSRTLRCYEGKILFPISILRSDGHTLVEVTIKRDRMPERPGSLPWCVYYVDSYPRQKLLAGNLLTNWAYMGDMDEVLKSLAGIALKERWGQEDSCGRSAYPVLKNYLTYTFYRLHRTGKVLENKEGGIAAFNTGLVDETYESIYACFSPSTIEQPWRFEAFCTAGSRVWGKKLVNAFNPLPLRAAYFERKEDLLFDSTKTLCRDVNHILFDNIDRLPVAFLEEELDGDLNAVEALNSVIASQKDSTRALAYDKLRVAIDENVKIKRRLINRLDDAIALAQKRAEWDFRTAVPAFNPAKDTNILLLPLDLTGDEQPDVALVVELMESGNYMGQTILTMQMAYNDARLVCRPDCDWLRSADSIRPVC